MADGIYIAMTGAAARADRLDGIAESLANAQTPGFKAQRVAFHALLAPSGWEEAAYSAPVGAGFDLRPGNRQRSGEPTDVLPSDDSFFRVQLENGEVGYTRDGRLTLSNDGTLTLAGFPALGAGGGTVSVPRGRPWRVDPDGSVRDTLTQEAYGQLGRVRLDGPLERRGGSVLTAASDALRTTPSTAILDTGVRETSNATPLQLTVDLVSAHRHYDTAMQALQTYRRMDERGAELGRVR